MKKIINKRQNIKTKRLRAFFDANIFTIFLALYILYFVYLHNN